MHRAALLRRRAVASLVRPGGGSARAEAAPRPGTAHPPFCRLGERTIRRPFGAYSSTVAPRAVPAATSPANPPAAKNAHDPAEPQQQPQQPPPTPDARLSGRQRALLEHTASILPPLEERPPGSLSHSQLVEISNGIDAWISTGEHRHLGAAQAELLIRRLIVEKGGGRSLLTDEERGRLVSSDRGGGGTPSETGGQAIALRKNPHVAWELYRLRPFVAHLDALYSGKEFVDRILGLLDLFEEEYHADDEFPGSPDDEIRYKDLVAALCDRGTPHSAAAAERVLHRFEDRLARRPRSHSNPPGAETYNNVLTAWRRAGVRGASYPPGTAPPYEHHPHPCSNLLEEMLELYRGDPRGRARMRPDFLTFNTAISSLSGAKAGMAGRGTDEYHRTIGKRCYEHSMGMLEMHNEIGAACAPDLVTFSTVINTLGRGKDRGDEARAREVLGAMLRLSGVAGGEEEAAGDEDNVADFPYDVVPRTMHFNIVLSLMSDKKRADDEALGNAKRYVGIMEDLGRKEREGQKHAGNLPHTASGEVHDNPFPEAAADAEARRRGARGSSAPDIITYNTLLTIAARAGRPAAAEGILDGMIERAAAGASEVKPNTDSFNTVLWAWSKEKGRRGKSPGKSRAEKLLLRMQEMADKGDASVQPDRVSLTTLINAVKSGATPHGAEEIVKRMEANDNPDLRPDTISYTSLVRCWIDSGHANMADRAEEIVEHTNRRYKEGFDECKPDVTLYNVAMDALAKSGQRDAAERAEALLNRMLDQYYAGESNLAPNTQTFATAIQAWARSSNPHGAMKAEKLLRTMHQLEETGLSVAPNTIAYSTCIMAWRRVGGSEAGERANALLRKMEESEERGLTSMKPNCMTYTNAMEVWVRSQHPDSLERVEEILQRMMARSDRGESESAPTTTTFNVVMKAIQHSPHPTKHQKAERLLHRMKELHKRGDSAVKPDTITYNSFFSACAMTRGNAETKINAFSALLSALIELQEHTHLRPDLYTWPAVWKATRNLLDTRRDATHVTWINRIFDLTIQSGFVNEYLWNNLRNNLPAEYLQKRLGATGSIKDITVHDLPPEWTCNVRLGKKDDTKKPKGKTQRGHRRKDVDQSK
ncbi:hypothetical protein ACHAXT_009059 [Thalassiosira profunda]